MEKWIKFLREIFPGRSLDEIQEMISWAFTGLARLESQSIASKKIQLKGTDMPFTKYKATLESENAKAALTKIITVINESSLTVEVAQDVLDLAMASVLTGTVSNIKVPVLEDISCKVNGRECAGPLIKHSHLRDA